MLQFASLMMTDLTAMCISEFGRHRHSTMCNIENYDF